MIKFINVSKIYNGNIDYSLYDFNLEIQDNEFIVIVGPSGCGKTTLVRLLSGLDKPTSGDILIDGESMIDVEPSNRKISYMRQNAKLFPHLNLHDNIALGLEAKKMDKNIIESKIDEVAEMLSIKPFLNRKPNELSGGELQRGALARLLVLDNPILIYDEPLSSLDTNLRLDMKLDIKRIHESKKCTTIYITHDKEEALSLASRLVVINKGKIVEVGTPVELYNNPNNLFTATFISKMNIISRENEIIGFRPEDVSINGDIIVDVIEVDNLGNKKKVYAKYLDSRIEFYVDANYELKDKESISINKMYYFDPITNLRKRS